MTKSRLLKLLLILAVTVIFTIACNRSDVDPTPTTQALPPGPNNTPEANNNASTDDNGIRVEVASGFEEDPFGEESPRMGIRLSPGEPEPTDQDRAPFAVGEELSAETIQQIINRLPDLIADPADQVDFRLPDQLIPPPITGDTIETTFGDINAPSSDPQPPTTDPLEVIRFSPEGPVPLAPFLSVTFNQPMVELATLEQLADQVPVQISPALEGNWRWLGTQTIRFDFSSDVIDRFPMATEFVATIPAGTTSAGGNALDQGVSFTFSTPRPQVINFMPRDWEPQPLNPILFAAFDQRIDPAAVLETVTVSAGGQTFDLELVDASSLEGNDPIKRQIDYAKDSRWLAFRTTEPFAPSSNVSVVIGPDTPSAEGPLTTTEPYSYSFNTYDPLKISDSRCGWDNFCPPYTPFEIEFNNRLDPELFNPSNVTIEPEIPNTVVQLFGNRINIRGATVGKETYKVTIAASTTDIFGQQLGADQTLTFRTDSSDPAIIGNDQPLVTLDPSLDSPIYTVYSINHSDLKVSAYRVDSTDWSRYLNWRDEQYRDNPPAVPGELVLETTIDVDGADDELTETNIDLSEALDGDYGQLIVVVEPGSRSLLERVFGDNDRWRNYAFAWVQVTQIGLDAFTDSNELQVWATALRDGAPLANVSINDQTTDDNGLSNFSLSGGGISLLVAQNGDDTAILPRYYWGDEGWRRNVQESRLISHIFDDRSMYRPGETVSVKGWLRRMDTTPLGDITLPNLGNINYTVYGPQGNELANDSFELNALGGFDFTIDLPENTNLGQAWIEMNVGGDYFGHQFQIQEFRRPEFEVSARNETSGPYFAGDHAVVAVTATYFSGGPLPNADVTWTVNSQPGSYSPPNWNDFTFGKQGSYWWETFFYDEEPYFGGSGGTFESFAGQTDASGDHYLRLDFDDADLDQPLSISAESAVQDVNRQIWAASTNLLVHPSELYVGLRGDRYFVRKGTPINIDAIVTDIDGNPISDRAFSVVAERLEWLYTAGRWDKEVVDTQNCQLISAAGASSCEFATAEGGEYRITAGVVDDEGRGNESQLTRWVSGGKRKPNRNIEQEQAQLIPSQDNYAPGDSAEILVQSPFGAANGLLTVSRGGILYTENFTIGEDGTTVLEIPITDQHLPNLSAQVDLVGNTLRTTEDGTELPDLPARPAYASGRIDLPVSLASRTLTIDLALAETALEPGGATTLAVNVTDANGAAVNNAEVAIVVVDEAILALTNYQLINPVSSFYQNRWSQLDSTYGRTSIILANPDILSDQTAPPAPQALATQPAILAQARSTVTDSADEGADMAMAMSVEVEEEAMADFDDAASDGESGGGEPIRLRSNFDPLAVFAPVVTTDANGFAEVAVELPDNLTRYRVMAVAVADATLFGSSETNLTARLPLQVRPAAPRFLNFGDDFQLPVVIQNQTDEDMEVEVVIEATNLEIAGNGLRVTVPANDRVEVRFPATTVSAGEVDLQIAAVSGDFADAATLSLPVFTPATTEAFATYGVVDEGAIAQPLAQIEGVYPQFGGLEIGTSSTAVQALTDAVLYFHEYRYISSESLASRILSVSALRPVLEAFDADGLPEPAVLETNVQRDINDLLSLQNNNGGFPWWQRSRESIPFVTIHVAHALQRADAEGFDVNGNALTNSYDYLRNIDSHFPYWYSQWSRDNLTAYALLVRHQAGENVAGEAADLYATAGMDGLTHDSQAFIWRVMGDTASYADTVAAIERDFANSVVETAGAAQFVTSFDEQDYLLLRSNRRTDAIVLHTLIEQQPDSDLLPKLVNGLLASKVKGRWNNTQENVFVLLALNEYFETFESETPDFVARIWLGDTYAGEHIYEGRTTDRGLTEVPMDYVIENGATDIILSKDGPGRLYYRLGLRYAPDDLQLPPLDAGFVVQRSYEAVDDEEDVRQDEDGTWYIKAGARVRVRLTMVAEAQRAHVALVDNLPAGLEIVNPALAVSADIPADPSEPARGYWWYWTWYDHQNNRDERAEAFATYLWAGVYDYDYVAIATTPGTFVAPPAKAEEMYSPEVFGRTATDIVVIED